MDSYESTKDYYSSSAPEVAISNPLPERAYQDHEAPQTVPHQYHNSNAAAYYGPGSVLQEKQQPAKASKKFLIWAIVGALMALAAGIGIGVGIGISVEKNSNSDSQSAVDSGTDTRPDVVSSSAAAVASGSATPSSAAPGAVVTGATTGVAKYSCSNGTQVSSSSDVDYILDCNAAYLTGGSDLFNSDSIIANVSQPPYTRYNLNDCLDLCDRWNTYPDNENTPCRTVTYYANLTQAYGLDWMGNCFLKSGRPADIAREGDDPGIDFDHTVSAYMSCLVNGGC